MSNPISQEMNDLRAIKKQMQDSKLPAADRLKLNNLMRQKLQNISRIASQERMRLQKTFACAIDVSVE